MDKPLEKSEFSAPAHHAVIGHTQSGKPVHFDHLHNAGKLNYTADDHADAAKLHKEKEAHHAGESKKAFSAGNSSLASAHKAVSDQHSRAAYQHKFPDSELRMGKSEDFEKSEFGVSSTLFMAYDGDDAGKLVGRAVLANDVNGLHEVSKRIATGHEVVSLWVENNGGQVISGGGDEGTFSIPGQALESIEELRADYQFATNLTMTVGVGASLSEAGKSLMAGKFRGKNQVVQYDPSVDQELATAQANVQAGTGSEEEKKISEAYLQAPAAPAAAAEPHCQYCAEIEHEHLDDDCILCQEANADNSHDHTDDCQYCAEAEAEAAAPGMDHEHSGDDCAHCAAGIDPAIQAMVNGDHEHTGDDCAHCAAGIDPAIQAIVDGHAHSDTDCQYCAEAASGVSNVVAGGDPAMVGTEMDENTSRPDDYNGEVPAGPTMGAPVNGAPHLGEVLQEGLSQQEDQIQKEKVMMIVGSALAQFKGQKHLLEQAQAQSPQLYTSTVQLLAAMIEMGKMLGLKPKEIAQAGQDAPAVPAQAGPAQPGQPAAAQGDAAPAPQQ